MVAMNLNSNTYVLTPSGTSSNVALSAVDSNVQSLVIYNGSTLPVFVVSAQSAPTVVAPTVGTPKAGKMIGPGAIVNFSKNIADTFIGCIQPTAGTGNLYISPGFGD